MRLDQLNLVELKSLYRGFYEATLKAVADDNTEDIDKLDKVVEVIINNNNPPRVMYFKILQEVFYEPYRSNVNQSTDQKAVA